MRLTGKKMADRQCVSSALREENLPEDKLGSLVRTCLVRNGSTDQATARATCRGVATLMGIEDGANANLFLERCIPI